MKTWTDEQLTILDSEYPTADLKELAGRLGKTLEAVKSKALIRKLKRSPDVRVWSPERRQKLIVLYPNHTNLEIASMLGSTESAVSGMAFKLKLRKSAKFLFEHSSKDYINKHFEHYKDDCKSVVEYEWNLCKSKHERKIKYWKSLFFITFSVLIVECIYRIVQ